MLNKIRTFVLTNWRNITLYLTGGLGIGFLLYWRLGSITTGYASEEVLAYQTAIHPSNLLDNPLNTPFYLFSKVFSFVCTHNVIAGRLAATIFGLALIATFFFVIKRWHGNLVSMLATLLFADSAWFLHTSRLGTPEVLCMLLAMLVLAGFWLVHHYSVWTLGLCLALLVMLLYVPGMIWFVVGGVLWQWHGISNAFKQRPLLVSLCGVLCLALLGPLAWAFYNHPALIRTWIGMPNAMPSFMQLGKNLLYVPAQIFAYHHIDALHWLGTIPLLDVFSTSMVLLGTYLYMRNFRLGRTQVIAIVLGLGWILASLGGPVGVGTLMPFIYILAAAGLDYLLSEWFAVFPRNPIAKHIGLVMVCVVMSLVCVYHFRQYFVGWSQAEATQEVFVEQQRQ